MSPSINQSEFMVNMESKRGEDCDICCEPMNKSTRKPITCYCEFTACMQCCKKYILDSITEPKCMSCSKGWTIEFIVRNMTRSFYVNEFRHHMAHVMMDKEKSRLPATQARAEETKKRRDVSRKLEKIKKEIEEMKNITSDVRDEYYRHLSNEDRDEDEFKKIKKEYIDYREGLLGLGIQKEEYTYILYAVYNGASSKAAESKKFIMHCRTEDCRGFLSTQWKCELCEKFTCSKCMESVGTSQEKKAGGHECKKEDIESAEIIKKETKACPSCGVPIFRILGCANMFCVECNTGFNWNTMKIQVGRIDNPHYTEWLKKNGKNSRAAGDLPCGGLPPFIPDRFCSSMGHKPLKFVRKILSSVSHVSNVVIERYNPIGEDILSDLRVKYLLKEIKEERWKVRLATIQKTNSFRHCVTQILRMYIDTMVHLLRNFAELPTTAKKKTSAPNCSRRELAGVEKEIGECLREIILLMNYSAEELHKIKDVYGQVVPKLFGEYSAQDLDQLEVYISWAKGPKRDSNMADIE